MRGNKKCNDLLLPEFGAQVTVYVQNIITVRNIRTIINIFRPNTDTIRPIKF